jgi:hypothetical protein
LAQKDFSQDELVYDWNQVKPSVAAPNRHIGFDDETLRDGLQSPSVCEPSVEKKIELLHLMDALNIDTADIGLPGAGGAHAAGVERLAREIAEKKLKIRPNCSHSSQRHQANRRNLTTRRHCDRSLHLHWLVVGALFRRRLDLGPIVEDDRRCGFLRSERRNAGDVCHRGYDSGQT